ncbi:MAG: hypothetical protein OEW75_12830 [Cyclobacteriaceae bacterium]|nr:hypothetical protein [Cyclobacteriaceae bacterium]
MKKNYLFVVAVVGFLFLVSCQNIVDPAPGSCGQSGFDVVVSSTTPASGCNTGDGEVKVVSTGGDGAVTFKLENGIFQASGTFSGLNAGFYSITAREASGCEVVIQVALTSVTGVNITNITSMDSGCGTSTGSITVTASGSGALQYKLGAGGTYGPGSSITGLASGVYTVFVRDGTGCELSATTQVRTGMPFATIKNIMNKSCAISGCHVAGNIKNTVDLTVDQNIVDYAASIKLKTGNGTMPKPPKPKLTAQEIESIACWVDDGARIN